MHKPRQQRKLIQDIEGIAHPSLIAALLPAAGVACLEGLAAVHAKHATECAALAEGAEHPEDFEPDDYHEGYTVRGPLVEDDWSPVLIEDERLAERFRRALDKHTTGHKLMHEAWAAKHGECLESSEVLS